MAKYKKYKQFLICCGYEGKSKGCKTCGRIRTKIAVYKTDAEIIKEESDKGREEFLNWVERGIETFKMDTPSGVDLETRTLHNRPLTPFKGY